MDDKLISQKEADEISMANKFFERMAKGLSVFREQDEQNAYVLIMVERGDEKDSRVMLAQNAIGGEKEVLASGILNAMKRCNTFRAAVTGAMAVYMTEYQEAKKNGKEWSDEEGY